jgi:hypothetical protein
MFELVNTQTKGGEKRVGVFLNKSQTSVTANYILSAAGIIDLGYQTIITFIKMNSI